MTRSGDKLQRSSWSGWRAGAWYAASLMLVALGVMGYLWPQHRIVELGYQLEKLESRKAEVRRLHRMLSLEAASLSSLARIERIAITQLGMVFPQPGQVQVIRHRPRGRTAR